MGITNESSCCSIPVSKMPIKNALVKKCPKCNVRLTTDFVSRKLPPLAVVFFLAIIFSAVYVFSEQRVKLDFFAIVLAIILTTIIMVSTLGYVYIKNKRKLDEDKQYIGSDLIVQLEEHPVYADIKFEKKYLAYPISFLSGLGFLMSLVVYGITVTGFIPFDMVDTIITLFVILLVGFGITAFYAAHKFKKKVNEVFGVK